jgi:small subunit ribosomal protein S11
MALRVLRASSSNLTRIPTSSSSSSSSPRYLSNNIFHPTAQADGPPTSIVYSRSSTTNTSATTNPLRLNFSQNTSIQEHRIHVSCTHNNTHITMSDPQGRPIKSGNWTGGSCGFKGVNRSGYEAGYQCAVRAFARVKQLSDDMVFAAAGGPRFEVLFKGFGQGREAVFKALMTSEGDEVRPFVTRVTDVTPIKIGGTRAKKMRRL